MKKSLILLITAFLLNQLTAQAQLSLQTNYTFGMPEGEMALNINQNHGVSIIGLYQIPKSPLAIGLELGYASYGYQTTQQPYQLSNGDELNAEINVTNGITNTLLIAQVNLMPDGTKLSPYIQGKMGASIYSTNLAIEDPRAQHTSECPVPLETDILARDVAFIGSLGLGTRYSIVQIPGSFGIYMDFNVGYTFGSNVNYMSVNAPERGQSTNAQDVNIAFASEARPEVVTEYHVGNLYNSSVEFLEMRFGIGINF